MRRQALLRLAAFWLLVTASAGGVTFLAGRVLMAKWPAVRGALRFGGAGVLVLALLYTFRDGTLGYHGGVAIASLVGVCLGAWLVTAGSRRRVPGSLSAAGP